MEGPVPLTHEIAVGRLVNPDSFKSSIFGSDRDGYHHQWHTKPSCNEILMNHSFAGPAEMRSASLWDKPLLRVWDNMSGSPPNIFTRRMLARDPDRRLNNFLLRKTWLQAHIDHGNWDYGTPFISFTSNHKAVTDLAHFRATRPGRGAQSLTLVDPRTRFKLGLPIVNFAIEAKHYNVTSPYSTDYFTDHWLCLWEVTPAEVVHTWEWVEFADDPAWYQRIVRPALAKFQRTGLRPGEGIVGIVTYRSDEDDDESDQAATDDEVASDSEASGDELLGQMALLRV
jgi:hypothetical protein